MPMPENTPQPEPTSDPRHMRMHAASPQAPLGPAHDTWLLPDGSIWCDIHRNASYHRMRFPGLADFLIDAEGNVECYPAPGTDAHTLEHLHLNQVVPAALSLLHRPVFHAGAVAVDGAGIAFVGVSGKGKSTIVTHMAMSGHFLLTDDGMELTEDDAGFLVKPAHPSVRLWDDSRAALLPEDARRTPALPFTVKQRVVDARLIPPAKHPVRLVRAYFLGDGSSSHIRIEAIPAHEAHLNWVRHAFLLDPHDPARLRSLFAQATRLATRGLSYRLDYPRRYDRLDEVRAALLTHDGT
jgi:hypothetical protein